MATFSTNQVRQLYVAKSMATVNAQAAVGAIEVKSDTNKSHLYFKYMSAGGQVRSDLIDIKTINYAKLTPAAAMVHPLKRVKLTLDATVNGGVVLPQEYLLRIAFRNFVGLSEEDQYFKYGVVQGYTGMTASDFYKTMALSLAKNFSREVTPLVKIYLGSTEITKNTKAADLTGTYTDIQIEEAEQPWILGTMQVEFVNFAVQPTTIVADGIEKIWGAVVDVAPVTTLKNGKNVADMEYFYMGERGDQYRKMGWPNVINTTYLVDPTAEYDVIDIHYAYQGSTEDIQKSDKDITIVAPAGQGNAIALAIQTAAGITVTGAVA